MIGQELTVGRFLQQQREEMGISLDAVCRETRITCKHLAALEEDAFNRLPGETFVRGFLRSYAKCIHLDPSEIVTAYERQKTENQEGSGEIDLAHRPSKWTVLLNFLFDFIATIIGASPHYSIGRAVLPPKR